MGGELHFDFGDVPETDEFGNILGYFSYCDYALIAAAGMKAADLPFVERMPLAGNIGLGLGVKFLKVSTLGPGSGAGFAVDLPFLFRSESPSPRVPIITSYGFGLVIQNIISLPIQYESGHQESWPRELTVGTSLELLNRLILAMDVTSEKSVRLGVEWTLFPALSLRAGLKYEGIWMWSLGMGVRFRNFVFNFTVVPHAYLNGQLRGSFVVSW